MDKKELVEVIKSLVTDTLKEQGETDIKKIEDVVAERLEVSKTETDKRVKEIIKGELTEKKEGEDPKNGFMNFAEFAQTVAKAAKSDGRNVDERLFKTADSTTTQEAIGEDGGYLVPEEFRTNLFENALQQSNIMQSAVSIPMATNAVKIPTIDDSSHASGTTHGGVSFYWMDELADHTPSKPRFSTVDLRLKKVAGLCYASDEILEDSPITMEPLLNKMFSNALGWTLDGVFLNGSGVGQPLGVLNSNCLIEVAKESAQDADTIIFENLMKMYARMYNKNNAVWYMSEDTFPQLAALSLSVGTGGSAVFLPANGVSGKPFDTLLGKRIVFTEHAQKLGDKGDVSFNDFSQYLVGQKTNGGMKYSSSVHLKFDSDQTAFKFVFRIDGQPWWKSAITPRNSQPTLSPFVTLAERA